MRKKVGVLSIFLILVFLFLPIASITMLHHITMSEIITRIDDGYFGQMESTIAIKEETMTMEQVCKVVNQVGGNMAVYQEYTDEDSDNQETINAIYFNGYYVNMPVIKGRFFYASDFTKGRLCAVVGKDRQSEIVERDGKSYIGVNGKQFEVLGIVGLDTESSLDQKIYINGLAGIKAYKDIIYTIDFFTEKGEEQKKQILDCLEDTYKVKPKEIAGSNNMFSVIIPKVLYSRWFIGIIFCDILCILAISIEWKNQKKQKVCIKRLVGCSRSQLMKEIGLEYAVLALLPSMVSVGICSILYAQYRRFLWYGIGTLLVWVFLFTISVSISLARVPIEKEI